MDIAEKERPTSLQLFGNDPEVFSHVIKEINNHNHDFIDINMGCPAPKIVKNGDGSALMKNEKLAFQIVEASVKASEKPVTVKMRLGWDENSINVEEIAKLCEDAGASMVAIHGRTREQFYSGKASWEEIARVKENLNIPVVANGDINDFESAIKCLELTKCDGLMIARAAHGNPWIFKEIDDYLKTGKKIERPGIDQVKEVIYRHLRELINHKGEVIAVKEMRKHSAAYLKGFRNSARIRNEINKANTFNEFQEILESYIF
jgi:tRNA-dihydrouridine synthase B